MSARRLALAPLLVAALLLACASPSPRPRPVSAGSQIHVVRRGETLWRIARNYGTTVDALRHANGNVDAQRLAIGQRLAIPPGTPAVALRGRNSWGAVHPRGKSSGITFRWPLRGKLTSRFGLRDGARHDGLDIAARSGTPVQAADAGRVIHSDDSLAGYGNMVIIKHSGTYSTVYAHNRRNLVRVGDFVERGQVIAEVGRSGRASAPHLHFEIRKNGKATNPIDYLP